MTAACALSSFELYLASLMPNSHRPPDTTNSPVSVVSGWRGGVNRIIFYSKRFQTKFLSATVLSYRKSNLHRRSGRDTDRTVLSGLT